MKLMSFASVERAQPSVLLCREWGFTRPFVAGFCLGAAYLLGGCSVATLPVKATSKVVDWSTTSQDEADRNRGREMRKRDEAYERCVRDGYRDC
ncbi:hypothetical protein JQK15_24890 [Sphingobium sp. BHU LFT2]|uniref:hypothetical protein n=1 Tax=Sphingobium sp. BHU LFT2 TaxID=2807634 RepID=UPI001BE56B56|nr:hypothetical protein [Sphingobium sp. BHU LFT2]MBT2246748.1 hypothetical protein [Sphingobium sp. BHU LFT2]